MINIDALLFYFIITLMNTLLATNSPKGRPLMTRKSRPLVRFGSCYLSIMSSKLNGTVKIHFLMLAWVKEVKRLNKNVVWKLENHYKRNIMICYVWITWKCIVEIFRYFCLELSLQYIKLLIFLLYLEKSIYIHGIDIRFKSFCFGIYRWEIGDNDLQTNEHNTLSVFGTSMFAMPWRRCILVCHVRLSSLFTMQRKPPDWFLNIRPWCYDIQWKR